MRKTSRGATCGASYANLRTHPGFALTDSPTSDYVRREPEAIRAPKRASAGMRAQPHKTPECAGRLTRAFESLPLLVPQSRTVLDTHR